MKRFFSIALGALAVPSMVFSQSSTDLNEGSRFVSLGNNNFEFTWWARAGVFYLVDVSADLTTWTYLDTVWLGFGGVSPSVYFNNVSGDRLFVRLNTDPFNTDADTDGMSDAWEILNSLNPRFAGDATQNPDGDDYNNLEEHALGLDPFFNEYGNGVRTQIYTYDNANKLTLVSSNLNEGFGYDDEGNLLNLQ